MVFVAVTVALAIALFAVFGIRPRGGRQVSNTQMMTAARVVLVVVALAIIYLGWR
jgi:hypothetical protein